MTATEKLTDRGARAFPGTTLCGRFFRANLVDLFLARVDFVVGQGVYYSRLQTGGSMSVQKLGLWRWTVLTGLVLVMSVGCGDVNTDAAEPKHDLEAGHSNMEVEIGEGIAWLRPDGDSHFVEISFVGVRNLTCADGIEEIGVSYDKVRILFSDLDALQIGDHEANHRVERPGTGASGRATARIDGFDSEQVWGQTDWASSGTYIRGGFIVKNCVD